MDMSEVPTPAQLPPEPARIPLTITSDRSWSRLRFREIWEYRELLGFLALRDIKVRYKQTVFGIAWALIQPLFTMLVFSLFFGRLAKMPSDGVPYPIFCYAALVPWSFFAGAVSHAADSMVASANLISKVYFPRIIMPLAVMLSGLVDFLVAFTLVIGLMAYYHLVPTLQIIWLPALLLLAVVTALGVGLWLSALNVQFRDVRYTLPFLVQFWLFVTPVAYPSSLLPEPWRTLYGINPMAGVVEGFRWALLGTAAPGPIIAVSALFALIFLITGLLYFQRMESIFADII
jgi:lipopolysaccharide transport system permease protein